MAPSIPFCIKGLTPFPLPMTALYDLHVQDGPGTDSLQRHDQEQR